MDLSHFATQIVVERQYGIIAFLAVVSAAIGYLFGQILKIANACYYRRADEKKRRLRNG